MNHYNYFEYEYYTTKYKDLSKMNKEQALEHFKKYGIKEKRKFNKLLDLFNYTFYVTKYKDLSKMNYLEACNHYIKHGIQEKRICNINQISQLQNSTTSLRINYDKNYDMYSNYNFTEKTLNDINNNIKSFSKKIEKYKNILFICGDYPSYGGAATNCYNLQKYYKEKHNTYGFYYNFEKGNNAKYETNNDYIITDLLNIKNIKFKPDLIILKSFINFDLKDIFKCPIYYLVGGIYKNDLNKYYYDINSLEEQNKYINNNVINQIKKSTLTFVNSSHTQEILNKYYNIKTELFFSSFIKFVNKKIKIDTNFENRKYEYGLIVSNFNRPIKNISKSINFLKDKKNVILIGKNSSNYKKYGFTCVDLVNNDEMINYYKQIKYIVQDSFYESCSNVKIESMFYGCKNKPIIVVSSTQYPGYGGAATNAYNIIKYLRNLGFIVCGVFFHNTLDVNVDPENIGGVFLYNLKTINENFIRRQVIKYLQGEPTICFAKNNITPYLCSKLFSCKIIYLVSGISYIKNNNKLTAQEVLDPKYKIDNNFLDNNELKSIKLSDCIICNSILTKKLYIKIYNNSIKKIYKIPIDTSNMVLNINKNIIQQNKEYDIIICCSNIDRIQKNMKLINDIFMYKNIDKYKKIVIGNNSTKFFSNIKNVECHELISSKKVLEYMQKSKIILVPSFFDSNPSICKEAILNNCLPIITNNIGCSEKYPDILICKNFEINEWVNKLKFLLNNYNDYKNLYKKIKFDKTSILELI